jgi:hypothetical protein
MYVKKPLDFLINDFWEKVNKTDSCWLWEGNINDSGYGNVWNWLGEYFGTRRAHRISLILSGVKIPKGLVVDHRCRVRRCVNPEHLRLVTMKVNTTENNSCPAAKNKAKTHCKYGHPFDLENTMIIGTEWRKCRMCDRISQAKKYHKERSRKVLIEENERLWKAVEVMKIKLEEILEDGSTRNGVAVNYSAIIAEGALAECKKISEGK